MNDEEFDELLRDAAATYNTPPAPPREAMWDAIASARAAAKVVAIHPTRRLPRWLVGSVAAAAVLMLGIAIGRQSRRGDVAAPQVATTSTPAPASTLADTATPLADTQGDVSDVPSTTSPRSHTLGDPRASRATARRLAVGGTRARSGFPNGTGNDGFNDADAYRLAVIEHLTRTEVLLTDFRVEARSGSATKLDAQFAAVSRELLGTTRMLLATRRGEDPVMTRLLQDLEYVLMQLSQYANDGRGVDLDAINQSIDRRNVLPKLRYSIPAGVSASAGT
jgi:hypothetical protein